MPEMQTRDAARLYDAAVRVVESKAVRDYVDAVTVSGTDDAIADAADRILQDVYREAHKVVTIMCGRYVERLSDKETYGANINVAIMVCDLISKAEMWSGGYEMKPRHKAAILHKWLEQYVRDICAWGTQLVWETVDAR